MKAVVHELVDGGSGHVEPGVGRGIIDEDLFLFVADPPITEEDVGDVADPFFSFRGHKIAAWAGDDF